MLPFSIYIYRGERELDNFSFEKANAYKFCFNNNWLELSYYFFM